MVRATGSPASRQRRKKILKLAKGYRGGRRTQIRQTRDTVYRALNYAYRDRKVRKRDFRKLWIIRINAACRSFGLSYSKFIDGLKKAHVEINRKILADMAVQNKEGFERLASMAKENL
jgi:large subunit ribosomal protein L20